MEVESPEETLPIEEVYIKEELPEVKVEINTEDENYGEFFPSGDQEEDALQARDDDTVCGDIQQSGENEDIGDASSEDENSALFQCSVCSKRYLTASSLSAHLSKRHRITLGPRYTCHICGALGQSKATLKRHLMRTHGEDSITRPEFLKKCRHCGQGLPTQAALYTHISSSHPEELDKYHCCPLCPALVSSRPSLLRHFGRSHPGAKFPKHDTEHCEECGVGFRSHTALRKHLKANHPDSLLHKCKKCESTFKYSYLLVRHAKSAHSERITPPIKHRHKCETCGREYRSRSRLDKHIKLIHTHPEARVFRCTTCDMTFPSNNLRVQHYRALHRKRKQPYCSECTKSFETMDELNVHRQEHKMNCPVCSKTFVRRDSLREHLLIHNGPRLPCPYCSKTFTQNSNLKRHIRIHTGEKPYKCTFCSKCFGDKSACNSHIRVHTGAERCTCHICGASFSKRQKLTYHMRKHTGEGLLHCPLCTKPTTNSYALKKHLETHQQPLMKVLNNIGIASMMEDCSEIALTALHNLAHLATQKCAELSNARKSEAENIESTAAEMSTNKISQSSVEAITSITDTQGGSGIEIVNRNKKSKQESNGKSNEERDTEECEDTEKRKDLNGKSIADSESVESSVLNDYSKDKSAPELVGSDAEQLPETITDALTKRRESLPEETTLIDDDDDDEEGQFVQTMPEDAQEQPFGSVVLQGTPAVVLLQLLENIVESHFGTFKTKEVRPTLGDQLVEQCLEVMMHDDTTKVSDDDAKSETGTEGIVMSEPKLHESDISNDMGRSEADTLSDNMKFSSQDSVLESFTEGNDNICDTKTSRTVKKDQIKRSRDAKCIGMFQRELLGDDGNALCASPTDGISTDTEDIPQVFIKVENSSSHDEMESSSDVEQKANTALRSSDTNRNSFCDDSSDFKNLSEIIKVKKENEVEDDNNINCRKETENKEIHVKENFGAEECVLDHNQVEANGTHSKRRLKEKRKCDGSPNFSGVKKPTKYFSSPSASVSFKSYVPTNGAEEKRLCD